MRYLALLRGINVGGKNIVKMEDLRCVFEGLGCKDVTTYIQSGNVLFESRLKNTRRLVAGIEAALAPAVVVSEQQLETVVKNAPVGFGAEPEYRYDVVFLMPSFDARVILPTISLKAGVDEAFEGNGVLYLKRLTIKASQSHVSKLTRHTAYKSMTIRNWNTTTELHRLMKIVVVP